MKLSFAMAAAFVAILSMTAASATADDNAIKHRQNIFKAVGGHTGAISNILKGAGDMNDVSKHADALAALAAVAPTAFPEGSGPDAGRTRVKNEVWSDPDGFQKVLAAFKEEADKLAEVAKGGDAGAIGAQLGALGRNGCKACHDSYRGPRI